MLLIILHNTDYTNIILDMSTSLYDYVHYYKNSSLSKRRNLYEINMTKIQCHRKTPNKVLVANKKLY